MAPFQPPSLMLDGKHAVRFGDGIALLDIAGDAYSCLYDPTGEATGSRFRDSRSIAPEPDRTLEEDRHACGPWRELPPADARLEWRDILRFILALAVATTRFHRHDFAGLLAVSSGPAPIEDTPSPEELATILARFERMALFLPVPILCLFRSFFLLHFLASYGYAADWVFGVSLFPFRAHCWLACGDLLLGETAGRAMEFSPIHVVRARPS